MLRFETLAPLRETVDGWKRAGDHVVLVPTMGALHRGHMALIARAREVGQRVVASIFVNPTQFGPSEDFSRYPRDAETDLAKLAEARTDGVWMPSTAIVYPTGFATSVHVGGLTENLCGPYRPGHFSGVATVVTKLLNQVRPDRALFGEKDFQQLQVIRRAVRDLDIPIAVDGVPTVRETDGLALSSRNRYLSPDDRRRAPMLHAALKEVADAARSGASLAPLLSKAVSMIEREGLSPIQYLSICDEETLSPIDRIDGPARVFGAAYLGTTRLIDNVAISSCDSSNSVEKPFSLQRV